MFAEVLGVVVLATASLLSLAWFFHLGRLEQKIQAPDLSCAPPRVSHLRKRPSKFAGSTEQEALRRMRDDMRERVAKKSG
jgi:hypothetical protein